MLVGIALALAVALPSLYVDAQAAKAVEVHNTDRPGQHPELLEAQTKADIDRATIRVDLEHLKTNQERLGSEIISGQQRILDLLNDGND